MWERQINVDEWRLLRLPHVHLLVVMLTGPLAGRTAARECGALFQPAPHGRQAAQVRVAGQRVARHQLVLHGQGAGKGARQCVAGRRLRRVKEQQKAQQSPRLALGSEAQVAVLNLLPRSLQRIADV